MRNQEIQYLRAYGLIAILLGHMPLAIPNFLMHGYTFVSLFLAIAGYFTVLQFEKRYSEKDFRGIKVFERELVNRFFRLVPLMTIWILLYYIVSHVGYYKGWQYGDELRWIAELKAAILGYYNYYLAGLEIGGLFGQFWTLYVEIHLFIILLLTLIFFRTRRSRAIVLVSLIIITIFILRPMTPNIIVRYATHAQADSFLGGALLALLTKDRGKILDRTSISLKVKKLVGLSLVIVLFISGYLFDSFLNNPNIKYFVYTVLSLLVLFLARENDGWFAFKEGSAVSKVLGFLGQVSASTYVSHVLLYSCVYWNINNLGIIPKAFNDSVIGITAQVVFLLLAAPLVGYISYSLIEKPYGAFGKSVMNGIEYHKTGEQ